MRISRIFLNIKQNILDGGTSFWSGIFPFIMATLFFFAFGSFYIDVEQEPIPVAVVADDTSKSNYLYTMLLSLSDDSDALLHVSHVSEADGNALLEDGDVDGMIYANEEPSLTVSAQGVSETTLKTILDTYLRKEAVIQDIITKSSGNTEILASIEDMFSDISSAAYTKSGSLMSDNVNPMMQYFYALISMACLYFCFYGLNIALGIQANLTPLAARRSISPLRAGITILENYISGFLTSFAILLLLLLYLAGPLKVSFGNHIGLILLTGSIGTLFGLAFGMFIGSLSRLGEGIKIALCIGLTLLLCFFSGLMFGGMPQLIEKHFPIFNRLNPANLISDSFYCLTYFDDMSRYTRNIVTLGIMALLLNIVSILLIRRKKYASI